ncbi:DUF3244 domain-containing protein, partial [Parabacteroides distasonis]
MKNVKWLLTVLFIFSICIPSFAGHVPLHGHLKKKQRSVNLDVPIKADIDETSKVLSLEFLEYIGEVRVSVVDANGNIVYEEIVDTQDVSSSIISLDECTSGSYGLYISDSENYAEGFFNLLNSSYKCNGIHINNLFKFFVWCEVS